MSLLSHLESWMVLVLTVALTTTVGAAARCDGDGGHKVQIAVVAGEFAGATASDDWLPRGLAFDLEKRLGRLSNVEVADRLAVAGVLRTTHATSEQASAAAVLERVKTDCVLYVSGSIEKGELDALVRVWRDVQRPAAAFSSRARADRLFSVSDELTDKIVSYLRTAHIDIGKPHSESALHQRPALSVDVYRLVIRGMIALQKGDSKAARPDLVKAVETEPDNWWAHYFLGAVEFHERRFKESAECCRRAIALDPDLYPGVYANLAYCYQGLGDAQQAQWAKAEFERRTGKPLPARSLPGGGFMAGRPGGG